jgi:hypothetical protein
MKVQNDSVKSVMDKTTHGIEIIKDTIQVLIPSQI